MNGVNKSVDYYLCVLINKSQKIFPNHTMLLLGPLQVHPCMHRGVHRVAQCPGALYICNPSAGRARSLLRAKRRGNEEDDLYNVKLDGEDEWQVEMGLACVLC